MQLCQLAAHGPGSRQPAPPPAAMPGVFEGGPSTLFRRRLQKPARPGWQRQKNSSMKGSVRWQRTPHRGTSAPETGPTTDHGQRHMASAEVLPAAAGGPTATLTPPRPWRWTQWRRPRAVAARRADQIDVVRRGEGRDDESLPAAWRRFTSRGATVSTCARRGPATSMRVLQLNQMLLFS